MKICSVCHKEKELINFCKRPDRPCGYHARCKQCASEYTLKYHFAWKAKIKLLKDKPCTDCGQKFPPCAMDFDRRDPSKKKFHFQVAKNWKDTASEIAKCDLVCANCHRIRTWITRKNVSKPS